MYSLSDYLAMIEDKVRTRAYVNALQAAIKPGATVVEIGTGIGYFAIEACRAGAARVYAIEPSDSIHAAAELARANGCAEDIEFIQETSQNVNIEPADVLVSDLRGVLPLFEQHIPTIVDARRRLLKKGGIQIPARDVLWLALAETPAANRSQENGATPLDIELGPLNQLLANTWRKQRVAASDLMSEAHEFCQVDYRTVVSSNVSGTVDATVSRDGLAAGISAWFDTELFGEHGFSNAPGAPEVLYGQAWFPLPRPINLVMGDRIEITLAGHLVGRDYVWSWSGRVLTGASAGTAFQQSTFLSEPRGPGALRKLADSYVPKLRRRGVAEAWLLERMSASLTLRAIAEEAVARFPDVFPDFQHALTHVAELSRQFSD